MKSSHRHDQVHSVMEDGRCLLDVIGDPKLLTEFLDGAEPDPSLSGDNQIGENAFKWPEEEFLSSTLGSSENDCSDSLPLIKSQTLITPAAATAATAAVPVTATVAAVGTPTEYSQAASLVPATASINTVAGSQQVAALLSPQSANFGQVQLVQPGCSSGLSQEQKSSYQNTFASLGQGWNNLRNLIIWKTTRNKLSQILEA